MKKVYAKFLTMLTVMSLAPVGAAMAADTAELPVEFELGESISISLSSSKLRIEDLLPGSQKNSNNVVVTVATNSEGGYQLSATVGDVDHPTTDLTNALLPAGSTNKFSMVSGENQTLGAGMWGYSTAGVGATTFSSLPLYTGEAQLISESSAAGSDTVDFLIGANAVAGMPAGGYTNVINFVAVSKAAPVSLCGTTPTMQSIASIKNSLDEEVQTQLCDERDGKTYYVAKLKDGNIWMTQNLDHNIDATKTYTSYDTDIPSDWTPSLGTYATGSSTWAWSYTAPESYDPGEKYWNGTVDTDWSTTIDDMPATGDSHYHIGNYYNWTAALAMNDSSSYSTFGENATQSICPAGWTLPKGGTNEEWSALAPDNQFYPLLNQYVSGATWDSTYWYDANIAQVYSSPLYFVLGGYWVGGSGNVASYGYCWSSAVGDSDFAFGFSFYAGGYVYPGYYNDRLYGFSVRCVAR